MPPDVLWIVEADRGGAIGDPGVLADSVVASQRMRVASPAAVLSGFGMRQSATSLQSMEDVLSASRHTPKAAVFSKILGTTESKPHFDLHEQLLNTLVAKGTRVIVDVCDNYFLGPATEHMRRMISKASAVIANSAATADLIQENTGVRAVVIGDPVETSFGNSTLPVRNRSLIDVIKGRHKHPVNLLWFGGPLRSFEPLQKLFPALSELSMRHPIDLNLVSAAFPEILRAAHAMNQTGSPDFRVTFSAWTRQCLQSALVQSDLVLLPGDSRDPSRTGASANRLIDAIWAGRYVVASGIPSYWEFRHAASIGDDIIRNLDWALSHRRNLPERIEIGQSIIRKKYLPEAIGHAWWSVLKAPE